MSRRRIENDPQDLGYIGGVADFHDVCDQWRTGNLHQLQLSQVDDQPESLTPAGLPRHKAEFHPA